MSLIRFRRLDLPTFEAETVHNVRSIKIDWTQSKIRRETFVDTNYNTTLKQLLKKAETEFRAVADMTGSLVVKHQFGLYPIKANMAYSDLLPDGYGLAAEVDVVNGVTLSKPSPVSGSLDAYFSERHVSGRYYIHDMKVEQFMSGNLVSNPGQEQIWLVDIDPRIHKY